MTDRQPGFDNRLLELVSDRVGLIKSLSFPTRGADEPDPPVICQAVLSHFDYRNADYSDRIAAGKARTKAEAMSAAIGEAIEHYCASHFDVSRTQRAPLTALESAAVPPPDFVLYSDAQYATRNFRYRRWAPQDELTWLPVCDVPGGAPALAPASLVYLTPEPGRPPDYLSTTNSNGLATGSDLQSAVLGGLYELIERDGFLIHWMNRLPAPELDYGQSSGLAGSIRRHYARFGVEVRVFNVSTDIPAYVMMAVALDDSGRGPATMVGLGCHLDPGVALLKSLFELCQGRPGQAQRFRKERPGEKLQNYRDVRTLDDHRDFAAMPGNRREFDFLLANGRHQPLEDLPVRTTGAVASDLDACVLALKGVGCRVLYADLTTPDVTDYGLRVVRVLATGLQPMHFGYGEERLGGKRLFEVPARMGFGPELRTERDLNPCPHPLA